MRLVIGGPTRDTVPASFAVDLAHLYATTRERGPWASVLVGFVGSTYVHVGREQLLEDAIRLGATHVLWLDTDMAFPPDTAIRLAVHDLPFVACNCVMRTPALTWTARREGRSVASGPDSTGVEHVDRIGLAVALMQLSVIRTMPRPWFRHGWREGHDVGEDVMFCDTLRGFGYQLFIDHELSQEIGHIGQHTYRPTHSPALTV